MNIETNSYTLPVNVRLWVYTALHQVMSQVKGQLEGTDPQLILEMALDEIVSRRLLPSETLGYDLKTVFHTWQDQTRNGFALYDIFENCVPQEEREVFKNVSRETLSTCFTTALMLVREAQHDDASNQYDNLNVDGEHNAQRVQVSERYEEEHEKERQQVIPYPSWIKIAWPVSVVVSMALGVCAGVLL